jgi:hypothetical protein
VNRARGWPILSGRVQSSHRSSFVFVDDRIIMVNCWAFGCSNRSETGVKFHAIPKVPVRKAEWVRQVNRLDTNSDPRRPKLLQPSEAARICEVSQIIS